MQGGHPDFEPNLKAGGSWLSRLTVPEKIRDTAGKANVKRTTEGGIPSCTWIIEVSSQVIFSTSATVHFELLIGRDEKALDLGFSGLTGHTIATPGQLQDHQQGRRSKHGHRAAQPKGIFSTAVKLDIDDTETLWNKPPFPEWDDNGKDSGTNCEPHPARDRDSSAALHEPDSHAQSGDAPHETNHRKQKRVHLVVLTHGLHSNLGSDLLYLKESIDAAAKQAREDARERKSKLKSAGSKTLFESHRGGGLANGSTPKASEKLSRAPLSSSQEELDPEAEVDPEQDEVIVRGFSGNAVRTERGIQYLGKRLAKYVLELTYPDQPFLPVKKSVQKKLSQAFTGQRPPDPHDGLPAHLHSSIHHPSKQTSRRAYKITSISFIAHSLGGLTQTYAIAYIRKHSPQFFKEIKPINFVTMASPFLGLSNENPVYVKFALDFGLVGRTGQDLGLAWRAPAMVRNGWGAMIGGIGSEGQRALRQPDPSSKPLLRILPTGPAHEVLKLFRNRTVYSNVVNDGIVPLRTSCLLFLDWSGLGRVEKARRENGIVGTMAGWGWAELTGANSSSHRQLRDMHDDEVQSEASRSSAEGVNSSSKKFEQEVVPQPTDSAVEDDAGAVGNNVSGAHQFVEGRHPEELQDENRDATKAKGSSSVQPTNPLGGLLNFLRPTNPKPRHPSPKHSKIYKRSQTLNPDAGDGVSISSSSTSGLDNPSPPSRTGAVRGHSIVDDPENVFTPPKTSIFESAGDILNPPLPSKEFIVNPASRPRTIFHDRVYHPEDIPPPPARKRRVLSRTFSSESKNPPSRSNTDYTNDDNPARSGMKVEEKIARAYHHDISWRKVLVRLKPDAHNNISVRRMFSNAYGWPVVKHLVDTHFSDSFAAKTADEKEPNQERAKPMEEAVGEHGEEVETAAPHVDITRTDSELREAKDDLADLSSMQESNMTSSTHRPRPRVTREDSAQWDDALFDITDDDSEMGETGHQLTGSFNEDGDDGLPANSSTATEIADFLTSSPSKELSTVELGLSPANSTDHVLGEIDASGALGDPGSGKAEPYEKSKQPFVIRGGTTSVGLGKSVQEQLARIGGVGKNSNEDAEVEGDGGGSEDGDGEGGSSGGVSELAHLP